MNARTIPKRRMPTVSTRETTGERIARLRVERGWSRRELGRRAGIADYTVLRAERGDRVFADTLDALTKALGTTMDYLYAGRGEP